MSNYRLKLSYVAEDGIRNGEIYIKDSLLSFKKDISTKYKDIDLQNCIACPGFIDTHIHGFGGFGTEDGKTVSILEMSKELIKVGVTTFFPTIYTDVISRIQKDEKAIVEAMGKEKGSEIGGIHIEGPFISPNKIGAQNPSGVQNPSIEVMKLLLKAGEGKIKAMTMAPELEGIKTIVRLCNENNIIPLQGHTDASYEESLNATHWGLKHFTHLFNAMSPLNHRRPGTVGVALSEKDTSAEIIADGKHVHPASLKVAFNCLGPDNLIAITDSLKPTNQKEGIKTANNVEVQELNGLWVTKGKPDLIQGSMLNMHKAFKNLISWGYSFSEAVKLTSTNAATLYNLENLGEIKEGKRADLVIMEKTSLDIIMVFLKGEIKYVV